MRGKSLFWGLLLFIIGMLFLLENIGIIRVRLWNLIWPSFLIVLGIWFIVMRYIKKNPPNDFVSIPLDGISHAKITISHAAGRLNITSGANSGYVVQGNFLGGVDYTSQINDTCLDVHMKTAFQDFPFSFFSGEAQNWSLKLTKDIPLSLVFENGADNAMIDLHDVNVTNIRLKTGASSTEIRLPSESGFTQVNVESGAASLITHIPENVAANIRVGGGISSIKIDESRFSKGTGGYRSADYDGAINKVNLNINMGVGSLIID